MTSLIDGAQGAAPEPTEPRHIQDAHRDVLLAVQRALADDWSRALPKVAVVEHDDVTTAYVSTQETLSPAIRADVRGSVRGALAPYAGLAPFNSVVFLTRGRP